MNGHLRLEIQNEVALPFSPGCGVARSAEEFFSRKEAQEDAKRERMEVECDPTVSVGC